MALIDLQAQINKVFCDAGNVGGTGLEGCPFDWDRIETLEFSNRSFRYEDEQDLDYIRKQQQLGNLIIVRGYESFTQNTPDPNINTVDGSGYKQVMGEMPTEFTGVLNNGVVNWKALRTLNGKDNWNVAFYDVSGNKIFTQTKAGAVKGFGLKMLFTGTYKGKEGNTPSSYTQMLQFSDLLEMERMAYITSEELDYDPSDLDGINDIRIDIAPLTVGATTLVFTPTLLDRTHLVEGLTLANVLVKKNGAVITPTLLTYVNEKVELTIPPTVASDVFTIQLIDSLVPFSKAIIIAGVLYKAEENTVLVV
jgi:hypothetical protein